MWCPKLPVGEPQHARPPECTTFHNHMKACPRPTLLQLPVKPQLPTLTWRSLQIIASSTSDLMERRAFSAQASVKSKERQVCAASCSPAFWLCNWLKADSTVLRTAVSRAMSKYKTSLQQQQTLTWCIYFLHKPQLSFDDQANGSRISCCIGNLLVMIAGSHCSPQHSC